MKQDKKCTYRPTFDCRMLKARYNNDLNICTLCLAGQQIDSIELLTSAIMEKRIDLLEKELNKYD